MQSLFISYLILSDEKCCFSQHNWSCTLGCHICPLLTQNIPCFIANIFCSVLGFPGKYLIQVMTNSWTLLHSFISQTAAYGDKTAGNAALIMKKCHKTASWEVRNWYQHSYSSYTFLLETYFLTLSIILDFIFLIKTVDFY